MSNSYRTSILKNFERSFPSFQLDNVTVYVGLLDQTIHQFGKSTVFLIRGLGCNSAFFMGLVHLLAGRCRLRWDGVGDFLI